jgi:hypothetical protein
MSNITVSRASGTKCERCWKTLPEVGSWREFPNTCLRCVDAVLTGCTGYGLHHHATKRFDQSLEQARGQGLSLEDAVVYAGTWNDRVIPFVGPLDSYIEPAIK